MTVKQKVATYKVVMMRVMLWVSKVMNMIKCW